MDLTFPLPCWGTGVAMYLARTATSHIRRTDKVAGTRGIHSVEPGVYIQVDPRVYTQVEPGVYTQVESRVYTQGKAGVYIQVESRVYIQVEPRVYTQVEPGVYPLDSQDGGPSAMYVCMYPCICITLSTRYVPVSYSYPCHVRSCHSVPEEHGETLRIGQVLG